MREAMLDHREAVIQALLAAADERDRLAEQRDRRADERDRAAAARPFTSQEASTRRPGGIVRGQPWTATSPASIAISVPVTAPISSRWPRGDCDCWATTHKQYRSSGPSPLLCARIAANCVELGQAGRPAVSGPVCEVMGLAPARLPSAAIEVALTTHMLDLSVSQAQTAEPGSKSSKRPRLALMARDRRLSPAGVHSLRRTKCAEFDAVRCSEYSEEFRRRRSSCGMGFRR